MECLIDSSAIISLDDGLSQFIESAASGAKIFVSQEFFQKCLNLGLAWHHFPIQLCRTASIVVFFFSNGVVVHSFPGSGEEKRYSGVAQ